MWIFGLCTYGIGQAILLGIKGRGWLNSGNAVPKRAGWIGKKLLLEKK